MMVLAVTLHNIPEGMAVGVVYAGLLSGSTQITTAGMEAQKDALLRLWTAKESYLKYLGRGLRVPLDSFCVRLDENGASLQAPGASSALRLHEYTHDGCRICLCTKSPRPPLQLYQP